MLRAQNVLYLLDDVTFDDATVERLTDETVEAMGAGHDKASWFERGMHLVELLRLEQRVAGTTPLGMNGGGS